MLFKVVSLPGLIYDRAYELDAVLAHSTSLMRTL
jgi:hypothetical protein